MLILFEVVAQVCFTWTIWCTVSVLNCSILWAHFIFVLNNCLIKCICWSHHILQTAHALLFITVACEATEYNRSLQPPFLCTVKLAYHLLFVCFIQDLDKVQDLLLGNTAKRREDKFVPQGLFQDRKHNNFFNVSFCHLIRLAVSNTSLIFIQLRDLLIEVNISLRLYSIIGLNTRYNGPIKYRTKYTRLNAINLWWSLF